MPAAKNQMTSAARGRTAILQADQRHAAVLRSAFCLKSRENANEARREAAACGKTRANGKSAHGGLQCLHGRSTGAMRRRKVRLSKSHSHHIGPVMRSVRRRFPRFFHRFISVLLKPGKAGERRLFKRAAAFSDEREPGRGAEPFARAPKCDAICFQMLFGKPARAAYALRPAQGILQDRRGWGMPIKPNPRCPGLLPAVPGRSSP